ncbi:MAG: glycosyltransferase family 2 protein [Kiritimatiellae bacterium]|nr:glycosyltransferase family 2 protein [Kiritimatiellia bacterium]
MLDRLSIIIVTYNNGEILRQCLNSLKHSCGVLPEIIVVDNANDSATKLLVAEYENTKYIDVKENLGFAGGNNLGLPYCTIDYILLLNDDTIIDEEPFSDLIKYLQEHSEVGVVQGTMLLPNCENKLDSCGTFLTPFGIQKNRYFLEALENPVKQLETLSVFSVKGALMLFHRELLTCLNGVLFYDDFKSYYEETDFCHRVWLAGREVHFVGTKPIQHLMGQTSRKFAQSEIWSQYIANILFSFNTLFDNYGRWYILPRFYLINLANFLRSIVCFKWGMVSAYFKVFPKYKKTAALRKKVRKQIQSARVISDRELFKKIMVKPSLRFYFKH